MELLLELLERIARVTDPAEACSVALESAAASGFDRAALVVSMDGAVEAGARGLPDEKLRRFLLACRAAESRYEDATRNDGPLAADPGLFPELAFARLAIIPFTCVTFDRPEPFGALFLEVGLDDARIDPVRALLERSAPALRRCIEVHRHKDRTARLEVQRDLLTSIVNGIPDPVVLMDAGHNIRLANRRAEEVFVAGPADNEGRRRAIEINNLLFSALLTQAAIGDELAGRELNLVDPSDGSDLYLEVLSTHLKVGAEEDGLLLSILRDITDLKRAVTEIEVQFNRIRAAEYGARLERDRLNAILENAGDPVLVTDGRAKIIMLNGEAERLFDVPPGAATALRRRSVRANDTRFTGFVSDFLLQPETRRADKLELTDPESDRLVPIEVVASKILDDRGDPVVIVSVLHDLTQTVENERLAAELKALNEALEDRVRRATRELEDQNRQLEWQSRELEKASRLKTEFLASMSHELRTPINVLLGYASLMRDRIYGELTPEQENALDKVHAATQHLLALINDILDLSKIEAGKMPVHVESVQLIDVIEELAEAVHSLLRDKSVTYRTELPSDLPAIRTDRTKLRQILLNLLSNAVKFTREGEIALRAAALPSGGVRIQLSDTGIGIKPEHMNAIFDDFRQVDQSTTREHGGTGLGLSITRNLLVLLGGTISVESEHGTGSKFTIDLPPVVEPGTVDEQVRQVLVYAGEGDESQRSATEAEQG